jgi:hypothetical protein
MSTPSVVKPPQVKVCPDHVASDEKKEPFASDDHLPVDPRAVKYELCATAVVDRVIAADPSISPPTLEEWMSELQIHIGETSATEPTRFQRLQSKLMAQLFALPDMQDTRTKGLFLALQKCYGVNINTCENNSVQVVSVPSPTTYEDNEFVDVSLLWNKVDTETRPLANMTNEQFNLMTTRCTPPLKSVYDFSFSKGVYRINRFMCNLLRSVYVLSHKPVLMNLCVDASEKVETTQHAVLSRITQVLSMFNTNVRSILAFIHSGEVDHEYCINEVALKLTEGVDAIVTRRMAARDNKAATPESEALLEINELASLSRNLLQTCCITNK